MKKKHNKYRNVRTEYRGITFASKAEAQYAEMLDLLTANGEVAWWMPQPRLRLGADTIYQPDFFVVEPTCAYFVDVKGAETAVFRMKKNLWKKYGPCELRVVSLKNGRWSSVSVIPERAKPVSGCGVLLD